MVVICTYTDRPSTSCRVVSSRASQCVSRLIDRMVSSGKKPGSRAGNRLCASAGPQISGAIVSGASRRTSDAPKRRVAVWQLKPQSAQTHNDSAGPSYSPRATITTKSCSPMDSRTGGCEAFLVIPLPPTVLAHWGFSKTGPQLLNKGEVGRKVRPVGYLSGLGAVMAVCAGGLGRRRSQ